MDLQFKNQRKSFQTFSKIYFWTATIHNWYHMMERDEQKEKIIDVFDMLSSKKLVSIYGFVIMPNHIHVIWEQHGLYGREMPFAAFMKITAWQFLDIIDQQGIADLFKVDAANKKHEIWKRDSKALELYSKRITQQKLNYIHANPISGKWKLAENNTDYHYSSAGFYQNGCNDFGFLKDIYQVLDSQS